MLVLAALAAAVDSVGFIGSDFWHAVMASVKQAQPNRKMRRCIGTSPLVLIFETGQCYRKRAATNTVQEGIASGEKYIGREVSPAAVLRERI
jgi:hypothetical protein